jgi:hypothetical protein
MSGELDFRLDDFEPADADSEDAEHQFWAGDLTVLAEHHTTPNGSHSFVVAHDSSLTWGVPGAPQIRAIKVARDISQNTFTFESICHSTVSFAQNWLIERDCPPERIAQVADAFMKPADDLSARVEHRLRTSGSRYEVLDSYTSDFAPSETWTLTRDSSAAQAPIRVFLEEVDHDAYTYTVREGAFADEDAALQWLDERSGPLPQAPEDHADAAARRTGVALARSTGHTASTTAGGLDSIPAPSAGTPQRPCPRRSL